MCIAFSRKLEFVKISHILKLEAMDYTLFCIISGCLTKSIYEITCSIIVYSDHTKMALPVYKTIIFSHVSFTFNGLQLDENSAINKNGIVEEYFYCSQC